MDCFEGIVRMGLDLSQFDGVAVSLGQAEEGFVIDLTDLPRIGKG